MKSRTLEHQARVDRMRTKLAGMTDKQVVFLLETIMGFGDDKIDAMGEAKVDGMLRAEGIDPDTSYTAVMGGVLAGLSRTLHDYRDKMTKIRELAAAVPLAPDVAAVSAILIDIDKLAEVPKEN